MWKRLISSGLDGSERLSMGRWLFGGDRVLVGAGSGRGVVGGDTGLVGFEFGFDNGALALSKVCRAY
jgi:hypothetical protein